MAVCSHDGSKLCPLNTLIFKFEGCHYGFGMSVLCLSMPCDFFCLFVFTADSHFPFYEFWWEIIQSIDSEPFHNCVVTSKHSESADSS